MSEDSDDGADDGYHNYIPTARDPGPSMLIATLLVCVLSLAVLPCLHHCLRRLQRRRQLNNNSTDNSSQQQHELNNEHEQPPAATAAPGKASSSCASQSSADTSNDEATAKDDHPEQPGDETSGDDNDDAGPSSSSSSSSAVGSADDGSSSSSSSVASSSSSSGFVRQALLKTGGPRPSKPARRRARKARRADHQREEEKGQQQQSEVNRGGGGGGSNDKSAAPGGRPDDPDNDAAVDRRRRRESSSSFSRDARDFMEQDDDKELAAVASNQSCCSCHSRRISSTFDWLLIIAEWNDESRRICRLGFPYVTEEIVEGVSDLARTAIVGQFVSTPALEVWLIVDAIVGLFTGFLDGYIDALAMHCSHAIGAGNKRLAGQYVQLAALFVTVGYIPIFIFWSFYVGDMVRWFGFGEETVAIAKDYLPLFLFAEYLESFDECVHELLDVIGLAKYSTVFGCIQELVGLMGLLAVGLLSDDRTLQLVGLTEIAELALGLVGNILIIACYGWFDPYLEGMVGRFALLVRSLSESHIGFVGWIRVWLIRLTLFVYKN